MKKYSHDTQGLFRKEVPKMPEGYYSGDKPNSNLRRFAEKHLKDRPYNPDTDDYKVIAFTTPLKATKRTAVYGMHAYHQGKKPHDAIRQYIRHYTKAGDLVLDPFCGSGSTALAAIMEDRKAIAIDRSPAATFITKNYCTPMDQDELEHAFGDLKNKVKTEIDWLYETRCDRCDGKAITEYTVYSQVYECPRCMVKVPLFDCVTVETRTVKGKNIKIDACPYCHKRGVVEAISTRSKKFGSVPVLARYNCLNGCFPIAEERRHNDPSDKKRDYFQQYDLQKLRMIEQKNIPYDFPTIAMIRGRETCVKRNLAAQGVQNISDLFTKRNLWALACYYTTMDTLATPSARDVTKFGLDAILLAMSKLQGYIEDPRFPNQLMPGTYYIPPKGREYNVMQWLKGKEKNLIRGYEAIRAAVKEPEVMISTQSACSLDEIPSNSTDYIFTDPPYGDNVQYGELNFVWEAWLGVDTSWHKDEVIVNEIRGETEFDWANKMRLAMRECYRVLKPGRWLSLCYHDTSEGTWAMVQDLMAEIGFIVDKSDEAVFIDTEQKSYNQLTADKVTKRDLVLNYRKPNLGEIVQTISFNNEEDDSTFNDKIRKLISEYLQIHPGFTKDRIYDEVVSRMVRSGRMEAHNFEELLSQVAEEIREPIRKDLFRNEDPNLFGTHEISRWYLKESQIDIVDTAESTKEDSAAESVSEFIRKYLANYPEKEGVHYSDIFEHFIYVVKDKPRRPLAEWLLDYFYKTDEGTYRLPISEAEKNLKAEGRSKGTNRRIKRYITFLEQGITIPANERPNDATLAEWIRHCKRSGLYEQGKLLYERGGLNLDNLPEETMVNVEEDYQTCIRMLSRLTIAGHKK